MKIHSNFMGGNISVREIRGQTILLDNEPRDSTIPWFYWAFCVEGAEGQTLSFGFPETRLGYFGPAVSHDLEHWHWLDSAEGDSFTYAFSEGESKVYFAHHMLYHPDRFFRFADAHGLEIRELCKGYKGSSVPCVSFGEGDMSIILAARNHACESTGNYVLQGVLEDLLADPIPNARVFCVPFADYEGVIRGDHGKGRYPHDHNRDYGADVESIYPECAAIRAYAEQNGCRYAFDFHSPFHKGRRNDHVFIMQNCMQPLDRFERFGEILEGEMHPDAMQYGHAFDCPPDPAQSGHMPTFAGFMRTLPENDLSFTLETAYFGTPENKVSDERLVALGRCFARAMKKYIAERNE